MRAFLIPCLVATSFCCSGQIILDLSTTVVTVPGVDARIEHVLTAFDPFAPLGSARGQDSLTATEIRIDGALDAAIAGMIRRGGTGDSTGTRVNMKIDRFRLDSKPGVHRQYINCEVQAQFLKPVARDFMRLHEESVRITHDTTNAAVGSLESAFTKAIIELLKGFDKAHDRNKWKTDLIPGDMIRRLSGEAYTDQPIFHVLHPKAGLYRTYENFCNDRPDTSRAIRLRHAQPPVAERRRLRAEGITEDLDSLFCMRLEDDGDAGLAYSAWGCSDGDRLFLNVNGVFQWLRRDNRLGFYTIHDMPVEGSGAAVGGALVGGLFFGVAGAAMGSAIALSDPRMTGPYYLDAKSGRFIGEWATLPRPATVDIVFYFTRQSRADKPVRITAKTDTVGTLTSETFAACSVVPRSTPLPCVVQVEGQAPIIVEVDAREPGIQIHTIRMGKDGTVQVKRATKTMIPSLLEELKPEMNRSTRRPSGGDGTGEAEP